VFLLQSGTARLEWRQSVLSSATAQQVWAASGILLVLFGSWLVAYEVVNKFKGISHTVSTGWGGSGTASKTETFIQWEARRNRVMWVGLACITAGSTMQFTAVFM